MIQPRARMHHKQPRKPLSQQRESWIVCMCCCEWPANKFIWAFLLVTLPLCSSHEWYSINIHMWRITKLLTLIIIKSFKCYKTRLRTQWFMNFMRPLQTLCSMFVQDIVRVGYSPSLLLLWALAWNYKTWINEKSGST